MNETKPTKETRDFGEKIGGARKDYYKNALTLRDLENMNPAEQAKYVKKDNIWKKEDPIKLMSDGLSQVVVYWRNEIRKALPASVKSPIIAENYIKVISEIRDYVQTATDDTKISGFNQFLKNNYLVKTSSYCYSTTSEAAGIVTTRLLRLSGKSAVKFAEEAKKKLYGIPKEKQLEVKLKQDLTFKEIGNGLSVEKDFSGRTYVAVTVPYGRQYYYPIQGSEEYKTSTWINGRFAVFNADTREILSNSESSKEAATQFIENYIAEKVNGQKYANVAPTETKQTRSRKKKFAIPEIASSRRIGPDYRHDDTVTGEDILSFGIRGGEFGNWLTDADAKISLEKTYDSFMDLARILGMEKRNVSHNGMLAIAFGARGVGGLGAAAAHFEPGNFVINLTRKNGSGCLAHEWMHSLDAMIGKMSGITPTEYGTMASKATAREYKLLPKSFRELIDAMEYKYAVPDRKIRDEKIEKTIARWKKQYEYTMKSIMPVTMDDEERPEWTTAVKKLWASRNQASSLNYLQSCGVKKEGCFLHPEMEALSTLHKKIAGRQIPKSQKRTVMVSLAEINRLEQELKKVPEKVRTITDFKKGSEEFDRCYSKHSHGYWSSTCEMLARAFDCYVADKLRKEGCLNQYLTAYADSYVLQKEGKSIYAIPVGEERECIFQKFDELFKNLKGKGWINARNWETPVTTTN